MNLKWLVNLWVVLVCSFFMGCSENTTGATTGGDANSLGAISIAGGVQAGTVAGNGTSGQAQAGSTSAPMDAGSGNDGGVNPPAPVVDASTTVMDAAPVDTGISAPDVVTTPIDSAIVPTGEATIATDAALEADATPTTGLFPPVDDLIAAGPYTAVTVDASGPNNGYTIYHPAELAPNGAKNPFLTWGNGMGTIPSMYTLLPHLASHGFVIIASNNIAVTPEEMRAGIDWLFAENDRPESTFYQKLDTSRVASMGYSLGSDCTFKIADDPRLITTVHISGGAFDKADTAKLRNPAIFLCGGLGGDGYITGDIARSNCDSDFDVSTVPTFYGNFDDGHLGILLSPYMEQIREAITGWLRWQLMADEILKAMFVGPDCGLCSDPAWTVQQKQLN